MMRRKKPKLRRTIEFELSAHQVCVTYRLAGHLPIWFYASLDGDKVVYEDPEHPRRTDDLDTLIRALTRFSPSGQWAMAERILQDETLPDAIANALNREQYLAQRSVKVVFGNWVQVWIRLGLARHWVFWAQVSGSLPSNIRFFKEPGGFTADPHDMFRELGIEIESANPFVDDIWKVIYGKEHFEETLHQHISRVMRAEEGIRLRKLLRSKPSDGSVLSKMVGTCDACRYDGPVAVSQKSPTNWYGTACPRCWSENVRLWDGDEPVCGVNPSCGIEREHPHHDEI